MRVNSKQDKAFYFIVPVWGQEYVHMLVNVLLRCCLAPNNIPALKNLIESKFVFVSDEESYKTIQESESFKNLKKHITPIFLPINVSEKNNKFIYMSQAYLQATKYAEEQSSQKGAVCIYLTADHIVSDGAFLYLHKLLEMNKGVYHVVGPRVVKEDIFKFLQIRNKMSLDESLVFQPREMAKIALDYMHEEYRRYNINHKYFTNAPHLLSLQPENEDGLLFKAFQQHPLMIDLEQLRNDWKFDINAAIDIDFLNDNLKTTNSLYFETDSDNLIMCSLTSVDDCVPQINSTVDASNKISAIKKMLFFMLRSGHVNNLHAHSFINTYKLHTEDLNKNWDDSEIQMQIFSDIVRDWQNKKYGIAEMLKIFGANLKQYYAKKIKTYPMLTKLSKEVYRMLIFILKCPTMLKRTVKVMFSR